MKDITEKEAAEGFYGITLRNVQKAWPEMYQELKKLFGKEYDFEIINEDNAKIHLAMAVIAVELNALWKFYPERAERIYQKLLNSITPESDREYIKSKIEIYKDKFGEYMERLSRNPHHVPAQPGAQLLEDWFGKNINNLYVKGFETAKEVNPVIAGVVTSMIMLVNDGFWKKTKEGFEIVD